MTSNIEIETDKDRIVNTPSIPLKINMDNIEIAVDDSARKPRVEIPERSSRNTRKDSSDSSSERSSSSKDNANMDYKFLINPKKYNPIVEKEVVASDDEKSRRRNDTDSERSKRTNITSRSRFSDRRESKDDDKKNDDYAPRLSGFTSGIKPFPSLDTQSDSANVQLTGGQAASSFFNSTFSSRKSYDSMDEDEIRKLKSHYLDQYEKKNKDYVYSTKKLTMKNDLEEIRSEVEWITTKRRNDNNMEMWKRGLVLFVDGVVMANTYANDPFDVDLSDWSKEMHWDVFRAGKYDEVLYDLIEKYNQSKVPIAPEWKLAFMMGSSLVFGVMQKKQEKAKMKKRLEEEKRMEEKVRNQIREEISRMQFNNNGGNNVGNSMQQDSHYRQQEPRNGLQHVYMPPPAPQQVQMPSPRASSGQQMTGPSLSDDRIIKMMEANFIDSTIALDDTTISTGSTRSSKKSVTSKREETGGEQTEKQVRKRGRPRKEPKDESGDAVQQLPEEQTTTVNDGDGADKVITLPARGRGGAIKRGRGRPPKNAMTENANVVTLDRL